jgi:hypothetical protein
VNPAYVPTDAGDANHGRILMAVQPLTQGLRRRDLACAPIHGVIARAPLEQQPPSRHAKEWV